MPMRSGTEWANHLVQTWRPTLALSRNWGRDVTRYFDDGNDGVSKIGNLLNIRKIATIAARAYTSGTTDPTALTETANTELNVQVSMSDAYGYVQLTKPDLERVMNGGGKYQAAYRKQLLAGINTKIDVDGATLASSLSTNVLGGAGQHITKDLLLSGITAVETGAKDLTTPGGRKTGSQIYFCYHVSEGKYVRAIVEVTAANIRGDAANPNVSGQVWQAYGLELQRSGNILSSGGVYHNLMHVSDSHVLGFNIEPELWDPQPFQAVFRFISWAQYGVGEVWDEYAADIQTG